MNVGQALRSFKLFTGREPDAARMDAHFRRLVVLRRGARAEPVGPGTGGLGRPAHPADAQGTAHVPTWSGRGGLARLAPTAPS